MKIADVVARSEIILKLIGIAEQALHGGFWLMQFPQRTMFWSTGIYDLLELDRDAEPSFELFSRFIHPDDRRSHAEFETIVANAISYDRTLRLISARNSVRWVAAHNAFITNEDGKALCLIGIMFDISAQHEASQVIAIQRQRFKALAASVGPIAWTARVDGYIDRIDGWEALTGQPDHASVGWGWLEAIHPEEREDVAARWRRDVAERRDHACECRLRRKDGAYLWISSRAMPVRDLAGKVVEWVGAVSDIHARRVWDVDPDDSLDVTGAQLRAARGLLNWSVSRLSAESGVPGSAIRRLEEYNGVTRGAVDTLRHLKASLRASGVDFVFPPNGRPGVRPS